LPSLRARFSIPVVGVIEPGAAAAAAVTRSRKVAVIGTPGTIASGAYQRALLALAQDLEVRAQPCPLFVPLAEEGWVEGDVPRLVAERYLRAPGLLGDGVDTLVLGCTHYPLLREVIQRVAGPSVTLVDSASATAQRVVEVLEGQGLSTVEAEAAERHFLVTDTPSRFMEIAARFLGQPIREAQHIELTLSGGGSSNL
jgi:glutamate racemase